MEPTTVCAACGAAVGTEEVAQGLAVKVSGRLLCPLCLDRLPGDAKVMVNQMRALRGMAVTTYRYYSGRHPGLPLFTFTTAALLLGHIRRQVHGEPFEAPPLPPPGSRPRMPSASEAARGDRTGWMAVAGVSILLITGVVWLLVPTAKPAPPPETRHSRPTQPVQPAAPTPAPTPTAEPSAAAILTGLEERLRRSPEQARAIADEAELLRDRLEPRAIALRNRADTLVNEALAVHEARQAALKPVQAPVAQPAPPAPVIEPAVAPKPPVPVIEPAVVPKPPAPVIEQAVAPKPPVPVVAPVVTPKPLAPETAPTVDQAPKPAKGDGPSQADITVVLPKNARPVVEADGIPARRDFPWPWPSGEAIHAGALDPRLKLRRLALGLRLPGVSPVGGATLVIHPGKAQRTAISACWASDTAATPAITIPLDGLRWQTIVVPAAGTEALDPDSLHLRLEDLEDLTDQRPFLVAGASVRWDAAPTASDLPVRLPLLLPPAFQTADGWARFRKQLRGGKLLEARSFSFARAKILLPFPKSQGEEFRHAVRVQLAQLQKVDKIANGNPADLPSDAADFATLQAGWPADGMDDLDGYAVAAFGWRAQPWGEDDELGKRLENLLPKFLTPRPRRPAIVPILVIGEIDRASQAERAAIDRRWEAIAQRTASLGVPVIDLRSAQAEAGTKEVQRMAARLLVDALRQLDWMMKP